MNIVSVEIEKYISEHATKHSEVLEELSRETHLKVNMPQMLSGNVQGQFLAMISAMIQPKRILEIGTFTGYSAICLATGLTPEGLLYTIDINEELQAMCAKYFEKAGLSSKIKQLIGEAKNIIPELNETFDIVFIDADKINYSLYYDLVFEKVRKGGFIIADNVLWDGKVIDEKKDEKTLAIHQYNKKIAADVRVKSIIVSLRDGLNIAQKLV